MVIILNALLYVNDKFSFIRFYDKVRMQLFQERYRQFSKMHPYQWY